jgi:hypothetical protein
MSDMSETENVRQSRLPPAVQPQGLLLLESRGSNPPGFNQRSNALVGASTNPLLAGDHQRLRVLGPSAKPGSRHNLNNAEGYLIGRLC